MGRAGWIALGVCLFACAGFAPAQAPLPNGTPSEEALRKLAAQLSGPKSGFPKLSEGQLEWLQMLAKDPKFRRELEQELRNNPQLIEQLKQAEPDLAKRIQKEIPNLPPGETRPSPNIPGQPPQPPGTPNPNSPKTPNPAEENREFQEMAKLWEQAVGPLDNTPAVKQALLDMFNGSPGSKPGGKPFWADWKSSKPGQGGNASFLKWLQGLNGGSGKTNLKMPKWFGGKAPNLEAPSMKMPTAPKIPSLGFSGFDFNVGGFSGLGSAGMALGIALLVGLVSFLIWKFAPQLGLGRSRSPKALPGLGPWPIDPRSIADRAGLIVAFEYISVLLCGDGARVWNHATIAEALRDSVPAAAPFAEPLARLYALARYTPQSEQLSPETIEEGRGYLCRLAGVPQE